MVDDRTTAARSRRRRTFISYRHDDTEGFAGHLSKDLWRRGVPNYRDTDDIHPGVLFKNEILKEITNAPACIVLIGPRWLSCRDSKDRRRLDDPEDIVRFEIATALSLGLKIIPVLIQNTQMPRREDLPDEIQALCDHNAFVLRDSDWDHHVGQLARLLSPWRTTKRIGMLAALGMIAIAVAISWQTARHGDWLGCRPHTASRRIAVIPFQNPNPEPEERRLRIGLASNLVDELNAIAPADLEVISLASVMPFLDARTPPSKIGQDLGASHLLTGVAIVVQDSLRISAEMLRTGSPVSVWRGSYRIAMANLGEHCLAIATSIAESLNVHLTPAHIRRLAQRLSRNPVAVNQYLYGRSFWDLRSESGLRRAAWHYSAALDNDPRFAMAWARLADTYLLLAEYGFAPKDSCLGRARAAAKTALRIDPDEPEGHATLGALLQSSDPRAARKHFERALQIDPNDPLVLQRSADFQLLLGKPDQAVRALERAQRLDPGSYSLRRDLGVASYYQERFDVAASHLRRAIALEAENADTYELLGAVLLQAGHAPAAVETLAVASRLRGDPAESTDGMLAAYRTGGLKEFWRWRLERLSPGSYASAYALAALGERDSALSVLEALPRGDPGLATASIDPAFRSLRSDPRFKRIVGGAQLR